MMFIYVVTDNISGYWELLWIWCGQIPCVHVQMYITMAKSKNYISKAKILNSNLQVKKLQALNYYMWQEPNTCSDSYVYLYFVNFLQF